MWCHGSRPSWYRGWAWNTRNDITARVRRFEASRLEKGINIMQIAKVVSRPTGPPTVLPAISFLHFNRRENDGNGILFCCISFHSLCNKVHFDLPLTGIGSGIINYAWQCMDIVLTFLSHPSHPSWFPPNQCGKLFIYIFKFLALAIVVINRHLPRAHWSPSFSTAFLIKCLRQDPTWFSCHAHFLGGKLALSESSLHSLIRPRVETNLMQLKSKAIVVLACCNLVSHFRTHLLEKRLLNWVFGWLSGSGVGRSCLPHPIDAS